MSEPQQRCKLVLNDAFPHRIFIPLDLNDIKKTFCYLMRYDRELISALHESCCYYIQNQNDQKHIITIICSYFVSEFFVKIYEDHQLKPITMAKKLKKSPLKDLLANDIILPLDAQNRKNIPEKHKYDIVRYEYISHVTLEHIALKTIQTKQLNPQYFRQKISNPYRLDYKLKMLHIFRRVIQIVLKMSQSQIVDLDISADNFIIKTSINGQFQWSEVIPTNCFKIDDESMVQFRSGVLFAFQMNKPMKPYCIPPEISADVILNNPDKVINIERFSVYQIAATFIYILFGQAYRDGLWYTLSVTSDGIIDRPLEWCPKIDLPEDLAFLNDCMMFSPSKRPSFQQIMQYVLNSIKVTKNRLSLIYSRLPSKRTIRTNYLYAEYERNGPVSIDYNPQANKRGIKGFNQNRHNNGIGNNQCIKYQQQKPQIVGNGNKIEYDNDEEEDEEEGEDDVEYDEYQNNEDEGDGMQLLYD